MVFVSVNNQETGPLMFNRCPSKLIVLVQETKC